MTEHRKLTVKYRCDKCRRVLECYLYETGPEDFEALCLECDDMERRKARRERGQ